jgi:hypothetical protein
MQSTYNNYRFKKAEIGHFSQNSDQALHQFQKGCRIFGFTNGKFSLIDLIHSTLKKTSKANVVVATWSAGIKDAHQIRWMLDSDLIQDFKILTDHSYKSRKGKYAASLEELFGIENIRTSEMHAKFVLIENAEYKVVIRTSMNLNANKTIELFEIDEDPELYEFLKDFVQFTFDNMEFGFVQSSETVNKTVKRFFEKHDPAIITPARNWWDINAE